MRCGSKWHLLGLMLLVCAGCSSSRSSHTARTSTEQLLIACAIDQSLDKIDFRNFAGHDVFVDEKYVDCVDKNYLVGSLRHRLFHTGARLVSKADDADVVVELRNGAVGTNGTESYIGIPEVTVPALIGWPEIRIAERKQQEGTAKIGIVAYDPKTKQILGDGGISLATVDDSNWFVGGIGPFQTGSLRHEISRARKSGEGHNPLPSTVVFEAPYASSHSPERSYGPVPEAETVDHALHRETVEPAWATGK